MCFEWPETTCARIPQSVAKQTVQYLTVLEDCKWMNYLGLAGKTAIFEHLPERLMDFQASVVIYVTPASETIHKRIDPRASGAHHFREHLMTDKWNFHGWRTVFI